MFSSAVKQEDRRSPMNLYTIAPSNSPPWSPNLDDHCIPNISIPQLFQQPSLAAPRPVQAIFSFEQRPPSLTHPAQASSTNPTPPSGGRIARPPNAFMLFRSDFLKRGVIPSHVESRQQNLSRVAGQMWNMLSPTEKGVWHARANDVLREHQQKFPTYKFTPAPRGSRRPKTKALPRDDPTGMADNDVRKLRETYTDVLGPSPSSSRKRAKKTRSAEVGSRFPAQQAHPVAPIPTPFFAMAPGQYVQRIDQSPPLTPFHPMERFPQPSLPRRPSTSLGFNEFVGKVAMFSLEQDQYEVRSESAASPIPGSALTGKPFDYFQARDMLCAQPMHSADLNPSPFDTSIWNAPQNNPQPSSQQEISPLQPTVSPSSSVSHPSQFGGAYAMHGLSLPLPQATPDSLTAELAGTFVPRTEQESADYLASIGFDAGEEMMPFLRHPYTANPWLLPAGNLEQWDFGGLVSDFAPSTNTAKLAN